MAIKVQTPLEYKGEQFYPLTTYDQVIMPDGSRWDGSSSSLDGDENVVTVDLTNIDQGIAAQINADLLGGVAAENYATKDDVAQLVEEALNNIRFASEVSF